MFGAFLKGWFGEKATQFGLWYHLDEEVYCRFHDVIVPAANGTTQIDHVLVSCYGIFVVETKNYNGWIFGDEHAPEWTVSHFGKNSGSRTRSGRITDTPSASRSTSSWIPPFSGPSCFSSATAS